ncbi:3-hydroxyacyl-ACP dehydratase FabZ [Entomospira culicis]|uniref:3-hydroxyacyl-ACP dehydratase FabZ n=1 Tax=Entomospira culicis TaxID=2719989 RepID=A0A968GGS4_9SPIO|nr:3-hydroxyacyl-ACP dehydratase FabZ [Entomospira culicis]NIZ19302.1 3-hydroxyacyl-ACP dehydratase FabZ [Entomospira culicis]NIZ69793.1 3-hydroxyacyl-ACP dehydratase FabZ [Entomospira culicis]WDI36903.1 3-hydroxyacyl-ACP dehydratase FabZ [Entomospira culicis]WDI38532.1 3-hydroxyacyl-ACP dehydratase FabZ [Entomospira culicis]
MYNVEDLIPHRKPFLMIDELLKADKDGCEGKRTFLAEEFYFAGHFPEYPVVPGVLLVEALAQCGGAGARAAGLVGNDQLFFLAQVEQAKFRKQVRPGDTVRYEVTNVRAGGPLLKQSGKVFVGDEIAVEASWTCIAGPKLA